MIRQLRAAASRTMEGAESVFEGSSGFRCRRGFCRLLALVIVAVAVTDFLVAYPSALGNIRSSIREQNATPTSVRRLAPAFNYDVSRAFIAEAQKRLPVNSRYAFVTGPHNSASMPITVKAARFVSNYLLLPRRLVGVRDATWLLCYGCNLSAVPVQFNVVWRESDANGLLIGRRGR